MKIKFEETGGAAIYTNGKERDKLIASIKRQLRKIRKIKGCVKCRSIILEINIEFNGEGMVHKLLNES